MTDYKDRVAGWATDIDWSKAPEGATHYLPADTKRSWYACWYKKDSLGQWLGLNASNHARGACDEWTVDNDQVEAFMAALIPRPVQPWSGDGLPPVGATVILDDLEHEVFDDYREMIGVPAEVAASFKSPTGVDMIACALPSGLCGCFRADMARKVKTPAQIAAYERESAIEAMKECFDSVSDELWPTSNEYLRTLFGALYDAGLRFPKGGDQ